MRVVIQIGFRKARGRKREGQLVKAYINDVECSWNDSVNEGRWITSPASGALGNSWYLWSCDVGETDIIRVEVKTSLAGLGADERRTFDACYNVSEKYQVKEVFVPGVGVRGIPLVKGRVKEMGSVSKEDERIADIDAFLAEDSF